MTARLSAVFLVFLVLAPGIGGTASAELSASGYLKDLYSYSRFPLTGGPYWLNLDRARLTLDGQEPLKLPEIGDARIKAHFDYDQELRTGTFLQSTEYKQFGLSEPPSYFDLDQTLGKGSSYFYRHRLYRAYAGVETGAGFLRFGRQRVAWGTGKLWNPTDVLNPYDPTTLERDERRGVDALYGRHSAGDLGQAEGAYAFGDRWAATSLLGRMKGHWGVSDFSVMGGKVSSSTASWMSGGDFSSNFLDGNLHGEISYTDLKTRTPYWKALAGYEYAFSSNPPVRWLKDAWILAEYFRNGAGASDSGRYNFAEVLSGREVGVGQDYAGFGFSKDLHPLLKLEIYAICNMNDGSKFLSPTLTWNAVTNFYLSAGLQRFGGDQGSEFGRAANIAYAQGQYFF